MNCQFHQSRAKTRCRSRAAGFSATAASVLAQSPWRNCCKPRASPRRHRLLRRAIRSRRSSRTSRPRRSESSICSWPARRAIWNCSTTSRNWPSFNGTLPPQNCSHGYRAAFINPDAKLLGPKFKFAKHGQCGAELAELLPRLAEVVDRHRDREIDGHRRFQPRSRRRF